MPNRIGNHQPLNQAAQSKRTQQRPKLDPRFQAFVDEALKENQKLQEKVPQSSINVSNHAQKRMDQRGIHLDGTDMTNLEEAFSTLQNKGAENSLIIYDDLSLIASVKNRTIITASKTDEMTEVTNIDSAIHVKKSNEQ